MKNRGDPCDRKAPLRSPERMSSGDARFWGEMHVLMHFVAKSRAERARLAEDGQQGRRPAAPPA